MTDHDNNVDAADWSEYRRLILSELKRLSSAVEANAAATEGIRVEVGKLEVKSGVWGLFGGLLAAVAALLLGGLRFGGK